MQTIWVGSVIVIFVLAAVLFVIRNGRAYRQHRIGRLVFVRNVLIELLGLLSAMTVAGLIYKRAAETVLIPHTIGIVRLAANTLAALLIGTAVGPLMKRTWGRLARPSNRRGPSFEN